MKESKKQGDERNKKDIIGYIVNYIFRLNFRKIKTYGEET